MLMMKKKKSTSMIVLSVLVLLPLSVHARSIGNLQSPYIEGNQVEAGRDSTMAKPDQHYYYYYSVGMKPLIHTRAETTLKVAGSSLPDCSHACGSCTPCRLVIVGFVCSSIEEAETCPMAYKCMCHNKSYPVP
ncbi:protein EPIDERMAL PATTERNING FACTOR 1-like [Andrographis paniculata]|uniref:protein EPIDERMAL PATTERNING FACTOR 1-like n=1 Tax=Andrographis paniculata TaxID=175694 RepID=UPI0021E84326|nr:protein EPIDERMAL PATTERNING FACTOR 1-like [Andrographis paniculata]